MNDENHEHLQRSSLARTITNIHQEFQREPIADKQQQGRRLHKTVAGKTASLLGRAHHLEKTVPIPQPGTDYPVDCLLTGAKSTPCYVHPSKLVDVHDRIFT